MSEDSSDPESACSSQFDPMRVLYSDTPKVPVTSAPIFENIQQFEASLKHTENVLPVGQHSLVEKREQEKKQRKEEEERALAEKNKRRFAQYEGMVATKPRRKVVNVLTRIQSSIGPLGALKDCVDQRLRIKVITRKESGIRGELHANLVAFDKQWNLALTDVLEIWKRKAPKKRKIPPCLGTPVPKGTAATISPVPEVTETPIGNGILECTRHLPQIMVRGEHVVLINIVER
ncbi:U7 snRNA-associated Sm-like protein LSm11 [Aricia agestis]|uniref:U7 snRNA-associated Sm-like protein LSm11 n=1 Tax=Aricia agestis TaxID=91739 RepID=UPI001C203A35|nr:U7 snRNA-associated Sm-like protein LSm11 [Aricia agestis]